ncbi:hypothetical protein Q8A67_006152 [Cirrhinus molitorella]|uniref:Uncharacterized protein n=1 Tax=Cirrhinus molitorella TaxID=172907 RepID=A0AA88PZL0_9TELE|nr:hypothetical protein Q8A67_006152 [Cirrhinus molitorella]
MSATHLEKDQVTDTFGAHGDLIQLPLDPSHYHATRIPPFNPSKSHFLPDLLSDTECQSFFVAEAFIQPGGNERDALERALDFHSVRSKQVKTAGKYSRDEWRFETRGGDDPSAPQRGEKRRLL